MVNVVEEIIDDFYFCENDEFVYLLIIRFCEIGLFLDWMVLFGWLSRGFVFEVCFFVLEFFEIFFGIFVVFVIVYEV